MCECPDRAVYGLAVRGFCCGVGWGLNSNAWEDVSSCVDCYGVDATEHEFVGGAVIVVYVVCPVEVWGGDVVDGGVGDVPGCRRIG